MSYFPGSGDLAGTTAAENYNFDSLSKDRVSTYSNTVKPFSVDHFYTHFSLVRHLPIYVYEQ
jgi:hypothetical protein